MQTSVLSGGSHGEYRVFPFLPEPTLQARIRELGSQISKDYAGQSVTVVGVLKGSVLFMADLVRAMSVPVRCEFLGVSSYGDDTRSSGEVKVTSDLTRPIHGQHVLVVEDIVDTGLTLDYIRRLFSTRSPASLKLCTLLDKQARRRIDIAPDYVGFSIPDEFVVGYGLDYKGLLRNLPYIGIMDPAQFVEGTDAE